MIANRRAVLYDRFTVSDVLADNERPLGFALRRIERDWCEADLDYERATSEVSRQGAMLEQLRCRSRFLGALAQIRGLRPDHRAALVREQLWAAPDAAEVLEVLAMTKRAAALRSLLPYMADDDVRRMVPVTADGGWVAPAGAFHVGAWVQGRRGGDPFQQALVERLAEMGDVETALVVLARIQHVGARVEALLELRPRLSEDDFELRVEETLVRARRELAGDDSYAEARVRCFYGLCAASALVASARARDLIVEGIEALPAELRETWTHRPGGLMLMLLAEPVVQAMDREGLHSDLVTLATAERPVAQQLLRTRTFAGLSESQQTEVLGAHAGLARRSKAEPDVAALAALQRVEAGGGLAGLVHHVDALPTDRLVDSFELAARGLTLEPAHDHLALAVALARRIGTSSVTERVTKLIDEHCGDIPFENYPLALWDWPNGQGMISSAAMRTSLLAGVVRVRDKARAEHAQHMVALADSCLAGDGASPPTGEAGQWSEVGTWKRRDLELGDVLEHARAIAGSELAQRFRDDFTARPA